MESAVPLGNSFTFVVTSTFGSEYILMEQYYEYLQSLMCKLRMMGFPMWYPRDNQLGLANTNKSGFTLKENLQCICDDACGLSYFPLGSRAGNLWDFSSTTLTCVDVWVVCFSFSFMSTTPKEDGVWLVLWIHVWMCILLWVIHVAFAVDVSLGGSQGLNHWMYKCADEQPSKQYADEQHEWEYCPKGTVLL